MVVFPCGFSLISTAILSLFPSSFSTTTYSIPHFLFSFFSPFHTNLTSSSSLPSVPPPSPFSLSTPSSVSSTVEPSARSLWQCQHCPQQQLQSVWQVHPARLPAQRPGGGSRIGTVPAGEITCLRSGTKCKNNVIVRPV